MLGRGRTGKANIPDGRTSRSGPSRRPEALLSQDILCSFTGMLRDARFDTDERAEKAGRSGGHYPTPGPATPWLTPKFDVQLES